MTVRVVLNGQPVECGGPDDPRTLLADLLRDEFGMLSVHLGCEQGVCGVCTVLVDGLPVKSCLMLAGQADGTEIVTVEGLATGEKLSSLQERFREHHALQCGFCTPGMLLAAQSLIDSRVFLTERDVRAGISGNLCRCTGYQGVVEAILHAHDDRYGTKDAR